MSLDLLKERFGGTKSTDKKEADKQKLNLLKTNFEKFENFIHLLNVFFVIRPFRSIIGIFFLNKLLIVFGQISESTKKTFDGFQ